MFDLNALAPFLSTEFSGQPLSLWLGFLALVSIIMGFDLGFLSRKDKVIAPKASLLYSAFYILLAILFGIWLTNRLGHAHGIDYFTAYVIELSLSLDNLFVMSLILGYFAIPHRYQHRILFWGIVGVLVMRGLMIAAGLAIVEQYHWVLYIFAAFLIYTGIKMIARPQDEDDENEENTIKDSALIRFFQKHLRCTKDITDHRFFVRQPIGSSGKTGLFATPLFLALICIEFMDVVFALDSVPAVFAISSEPFIVYSSNIFAIIGLRSMYFAVVALLDRFKYMDYALCIVLVFIGGKVFYGGLFEPLNHFVSLGITLGVLAGGIFYSLYKTRKVK